MSTSWSVFEQQGDVLYLDTAQASSWAVIKATGDALFGRTIVNTNFTTSTPTSQAQMDASSWAIVRGLINTQLTGASATQLLAYGDRVFSTSWS